MWTQICRNETLSALQRNQYLTKFEEQDELMPFMFFRIRDRHLPEYTFSNRDLVRIGSETQTQRFEAEDVRWGLHTGANGIGEEYVSIFSGGGPYIPIVLDGPSWIEIRVRALQSQPPPILFSVIIHDDGRQVIDTVAFDAGDQTWAVASVQTELSGGCYWIEIPFINDYMDQESGLDRNAYLDWVEIEKIIR